MEQVTMVKRTSVLFALVMALVLVLSTLGASDAEAKKRPAKASRMTTSATIECVDDEIWPFSDEINRSQGDNVVVLSNSVSRNLLRHECRVGGEVRVELDLSGQRSRNGSVFVSGEARLYEGTSEDTQDLDGKKNFSILVPSGKTVNLHQRVDNTDEGGDFADIEMSFHNAPVKRR